MKESDWLKLIVWGICTLFVIDWVFTLINLSSTIGNIIGLLLGGVFTWLSIKTKCFIGINFKKNKENEESI